MKRALPLLLLLIVGAAVGLAIRSPKSADGPFVCDDCNVVLILVDTLRADHLGTYGYSRETSPFLDQLAERGLRFDSAHSQAACTFPSVNSLLTSRFPQSFMDAETRPAIPAEIPTLPQILRRHGYATASVSASPIVRETPSKHNPVGGYGAGFDVFDEFCHWRESTCVSTRARDQLDRLEQPFFLYLHFMDPHDPYHPLPETRGTFAGDYEGDHPFIAKGDPNPIEGLVREQRARQELEPEDIEHLIDLYDEEILSFDIGLKQLFQHLEERKLLEKTIIVLTSDHGEGFLEHDTVKHCYSVYDTETRIPMLMLLPGAEASGGRSNPVQNIDILPTLLDYLGLPVEELKLAGRSLRPVIELGEDAASHAFSIMGAYRSVNDKRFKLIYDLRDNRFRLYDLIEDPGELQDLLSSDRRTFHALREILEGWLEEVEGDENKSERLRKAKEIEDELRALGYLG